MRARITHWRARLWALLTGVRFDRAMERHRQAAQELDKAVREVLKT